MLNEGKIDKFFIWFLFHSLFHRGKNKKSCEDLFMTQAYLSL